VKAINPQDLPVESVRASAAQRAEPEARNRGVSALVTLLGAPKSILFVGEMVEGLPQTLEEKGCSLSFILSKTERADEARVFSSDVQVADLTKIGLSDVALGRKFDGIVLDCAQESLPHLPRAIADTRGLLADGGCVIGILRGAGNDPELDDDATTALQSLYRDFLLGGFEVSSVERVALAGSGDHPLDDAPQYVVANAIKAVPLATGKVSAIARFDERSTRSADTALRAVVRRVLELEQSRASVEADLKAAQLSAAVASEKGRRFDAAVLEAERSFETIATLQGHVAHLSARIVELETTARDANTEPSADDVRETLRSELEATRKQAIRSARETRQTQARIIEMQARLESALAVADEKQLQLEQHASRLAELETVLAERSRLLEDFEPQRRDMVARITQLEEIEIALRGELNEARATIVDASGQAADTASRLAAMQEASEQINSELTRVSEALEQRTAEFALSESERLKTAEKLAALQEAYSASEMELRRAQSRHQAEKARQRRRIEHYAQLERFLASDQTTLLALKSELGTAYDRMARMRMSQAAATEKLATLQASLQTQLAAQAATLAQRSARVSELESARAEHTGRLSALKTMVEASADRVDALEAMLKSAHNDLSDTRDALEERRIAAALWEEELARTRSALDQSEERTAHLVQTIEANAAASERAWYELYADLEDAKAQSRQAEVEISRQSVRIHELVTKLDETRESHEQQRSVLRQEVAEALDALQTVRSELVQERKRSERLVGEISVFKVRCAEIPILKVRAIKSEKYGELLQARSSELADEIKALEDGLKAASGREADLRSQTDAAGRQISHMASEISAARDREIRLQADVAKALEHAQRLEADLLRSAAHALQRDEELSSEMERTEQLRTTVDQLQLSLDELNATNSALETKLSESERLLITQTEELCATTQAESSQIATLIDVVQASHFWKVKRWLSRIASPFRRLV